MEELLVPMGRGLRWSVTIAFSASFPVVFDVQCHSWLKKKHTIDCARDCIDDTPLCAEFNPWRVEALRDHQTMTLSWCRITASVVYRESLYLLYSDIFHILSLSFPQ